MYIYNTAINLETKIGNIIANNILLDRIKSYVWKWMYIFIRAKDRAMIYYMNQYCWFMIESQVFIILIFLEKVFQWLDR